MNHTIKTVNDYNLDESADIIIAEGLGWAAFKEGKIKAPCQDPELTDIMQRHRIKGQLFTEMSTVLMRAWLRGQQASSLAA